MSQRALIQLGLVLLMLSIGCSFLTHPLTDEPLCNVDAGVAKLCPTGLTCENGRCVRNCLDREVCGDSINNDCDEDTDEPNDPSMELCGDGDDNDCDGTPDEGSDIDKDGVTWCGNPRDPTEPRDCEDRDPNQLPGGVEVCDGINNDCDTEIDEQAPCPPDETCSPERGRCVREDCTSNPSMCKAGEVCSALTGACEPLPAACANVRCNAGEECVDGVCREKPKLGNGRPCVADADCLSKVCSDASALRMKGLKVCVQACCGDESCTVEGERCFASGSGARSCLPEAMFPTGARKYEQCAHKGVCPMDQECALATDQFLSTPFEPVIPMLATPVCKPPLPGARPPGARRQEGVPCSSNVGVDAVFSGEVCSLACGESSQCAEFGKTALFTDQAYCRYQTVRQAAFGRPSDYAAFCVVRRDGEAGKGKWGDQCKSGLDCLERGCVTSGGVSRCSPTCCDNSSCKTELGSQAMCRPFKLGMGYEMRCDTVF